MTCYEIVGPPGSGKTTLAQELVRLYPRARLVGMPAPRVIRYAPFFISNVLALSPLLVAMISGPSGRRINRKELLWMTCLNGWHRPLARRDSDRTIILLDQGPIYWTFGLDAYRRDQLKDSMLGHWLGRAVGRWAGLLDGVIWLDASDEVLARRIESREKSHLIKGAGPSRVHEFLEESRLGLWKAIDMMRSGLKGPAISRFDTETRSIAEMAWELSKEFGGPAGVPTGRHGLSGRN